MTLLESFSKRDTRAMRPAVSLTFVRDEQLLQILGVFVGQEWRPSLHFLLGTRLFPSRYRSRHLFCDTRSQMM